MSPKVAHGEQHLPPAPRHPNRPPPSVLGGKASAPRSGEPGCPWSVVSGTLRGSLCSRQILCLLFPESGPTLREAGF